MSLPSDAPALVLAVPGSPSPASEQIASDIAAAASLSCQGAEVRVGYLDGDGSGLDEALNLERNAAWPALAVIVPLLAGPNPQVDEVLQGIAADSAGEILLAEHLGPHPLLAEALHERLAESGLARQSRARGLSIAVAANGVLVLADHGSGAAQSAGVAAVLLAARLAAPVAHASVDDSDGIAAALGRLREAGASRLAIAPCVIGPEADPAEFEAVAAAAGALSARPLGAHSAISRLAAMRYGAALASLRPTGTSA